MEQSLLYDFYGELLNEHQQRIYEDAIFNDLSLSEIAQQQEITRQGVHDILKRCARSLDEYERKLHLLQRFLKIKEEVERIQILALKVSQENDSREIREIQEISRQMIEEL
ncbi:MAG: DNA-binding protein [Lachnospiraceae bacterium]